MNVEVVVGKVDVPVEVTVVVVAEDFEVLIFGAFVLLASMASSVTISVNGHKDDDGQLAIRTAVESVNTNDSRLTRFYFIDGDGIILDTGYRRRSSRGMCDLTRFNLSTPVSR